jgi:hypothetical protein
MAATSELKKVKLNVTNIKSVLLDGKKAVDEKKKDREDFLAKLEEEKKQRQQEKGLEKPIKPNQKPDLKSPVKSSMGLVDRIFNFVGAIVGGIVVKALPDIIDAIKKLIEKVKPFFDGVVEFLEPVFTSIGNLFTSEDSYESEKEKVNGDIENAQLAGKGIDSQVKELDKASDDIVNENKGLAANSNALGGEEKGLLKDRETKDDDDKDDDEVKNNDDSNKVESNEVLTVENIGPAPASVVTEIVDGKEVVVTDMDESLKIQNEARDMLREATGGGDSKISTEISGANIITPPSRPNREDYPKNHTGNVTYQEAYKNYIIEMKKFKKVHQNLVKPTDKNKNGLTALNTTEGLTSSNVSSSKTIILQRQIVRVNTPVQV